MNRFIILLIYIWLTVTNGLSQQGFVPKHSISLDGAFSYQTYIDIEQEPYTDDFRKVKPGFLIGSNYNFITKGLILNAGIGFTGSVYRVDSITLFSGPAGSTKGYARVTHFFARLAICIGYDLRLNERNQIHLFGG